MSSDASNSTEERARQRQLGLPREAIPLWVFEGLVDHSESIDAAARLLGREASSIDADGYERDIIAAAIDRDGRRIAWVESKYKELSKYVDVEYRLHLRGEEGRSTEWVVETYNPYFGCHVYEIAWQGDGVCLVYHEKHEIYAAAVDLGGRVNRVCTRHCWRINEHEIGCAGAGPDRIERRAWPSLETLGAMTLDEAKMSGMPERALYRFGARPPVDRLDRPSINPWIAYPVAALVISTFVLFVGSGQQRLTLIEVIATYALTLFPALILAWLKL